MKSSINLSLTTIVVSVLIITGCTTVGPDYKAPGLDSTEMIEPKHHFDNLLVNDAHHKQTWWELFNDNNLNQLIAVADEHNPSVVIAQANLAKALAVFDDVENDDWPQGDLLAQYTAQRQVLAGGGDTRASVRSRQLGLSAGWELDMVGKFARAEEAAAADAESAYYAWQDARLSLLSSLADTYVRYRGLKNRVMVMRDTLDTLSTTQQVVEAQVESGFATELDRLRVKSQIASVRSQLPALEAAIEAARQTLIALSGGADKLKGFDWNRTAIPALHEPISLVGNEDFLQFRPDVMAAERNLAATSAAIGIAEADLYPSVSLNGFLGFFSNSGNVISADAKAWSLAPSLQWQVLDMNSVRARIRVAEAGHRESLARFEETVLNAVAEVVTALSDYSHLQRRLHEIDQQVLADEEALSIAKYQYKNGSIDLLNMLDVERQWLTSRDERVTVLTQVTASLIKIYSSMGGGFLTQS